MSIITVPKWVRDAIFYQIFPDRFARGSNASPASNLMRWGGQPTNNSFAGGDLTGIVERFDYLQELGITAIYLNPIFQSASNHRYHTHDYYTVDPLLGGNNALLRLLDEAHKRKMRVILDGVFNHASRGFFQFNHVLECESESPYKDWFNVRAFPLEAYSRSRRPNYDCWWGMPQLPKFNTNNPEVRRFLFDVARYWIELGADGWRLDVPGEIDDDSFWQEFRSVVKKANPNAYIFGEIWVDEQKMDGRRWLRGDQFDGIMNYGLLSACIAFFVGKNLEKELVRGQGHEPERHMNAEEFAHRINLLLDRYDREIIFSQYNLLDSHDTARFLTLLHSDRRIYKLALIFLLTYPGAPSIYYGDEVGLTGRRDPDCRRCMPWDRREWDMEIYDLTKRLIAIRTKETALRHGWLTTLYADSEYKRNVLAYVRSFENESIVVIINNSESIYPVDIAVGDFIKNNTEMTCLLSSTSYSIHNNRITGHTLQPRSALILKA